MILRCKSPSLYISIAMPLLSTRRGIKGQWSGIPVQYVETRNTSRIPHRNTVAANIPAVIESFTTAMERTADVEEGRLKLRSYNIVIQLGQSTSKKIVSRRELK